MEAPGTRGLEGGLGKSGWVLLGEEYTGETWGSLGETGLHPPAHPPLTAAIDQPEVTECPLFTWVRGTTGLLHLPT